MYIQVPNLIANMPQGIVKTQEILGRFRIEKYRINLKMKRYHENLIACRFTTC